MPLTMRPTRLGAGIDQDRQDFTAEPWRVNSPFSVLAGRTPRPKVSGERFVQLGPVASFTRPISRRSPTPSQLFAKISIDPR